MFILIILVPIYIYIKFSSTVVLRELHQCTDQRFYMKSDVVNVYNLSMRLESSHCQYGLPNTYGLDCTITFVDANKFYNLGRKLCVDVENVPQSIGNRTQLRLSVKDRKNEALKVCYV